MSRSTTLTEVMGRLALPHDRAVLIIVGWAAGEFDLARGSIGLLLRQVIAPTCQDHGAVVLTGGTDVGIMAMTGEAMAEFAPDAVLVGVAPHRKLRDYGADPEDEDVASAEPNHTRLVGALGHEWGDESSTLIGVAERIATRDRIAMLVIGGGRHTAEEVSAAIERDWPVLLVTGCGAGGLSDALAAELWSSSSGEDQTTPSSRTSESSQQSIHQLSLAAAEHRHLFASRHVRDHARIARALRWRLCDDRLLKEAWGRYALADGLSSRAKRPVNRRIAVAIFLATLTVFASIVRAYAHWRYGADHWLVVGLLGLVTGLPLLAAVVLISISRRSRSGGWIGMRAAAETTLSEIYRYRASADDYSRDEHGCQPDGAAAGLLLGQSLLTIDQRVDGRSSGRFGEARSPRPISTRNLDPSPPRTRSRQTWPPERLEDVVDLADPLLCEIDAQTYDSVRVEGQIEWLTDVAQTEERLGNRLAIVIGCLGAVAALSLATAWREPLALGLAGVTTAVVGALVTWREYKRRDDRADSFRSTAAELRSSRARWLAAPGDRRNVKNEVARYVSQVEGALSAENSAWERALRQSHRAIVERYGGR